MRPESALENAFQTAEQQSLTHKSLSNIYSLFEAVPFAVAVLKGPDLIIEFINEYNLGIWQCRKEEVLGKPLFEARPDIRVTAQPLHEEIYRTGKRFEAKEISIHLREHGKNITRYFDAVIDPLKDDTGTIIGQLATSIDVTEKVLARRKLEESAASAIEAKNEAEKMKRLYEAVTGSTPDLVYVFDLNYRFTYANPALLAMWGRSWDQAIGKGLRDLGYEEWHAQMHEREIDEIVATRKSIRSTVSFPHAELGKRIYDYLLSPVVNEKGEVEAIAGITRDVSEANAKEEALKESEQRFRLMADTIPEMIWVTDDEGKIEFMNQRWQEYCGVPLTATTAEEVATAFVHPDDAPHLMATLMHSLQTGEIMEVEQRNRSASGEYRWFINRATPYRDPNTGKVVKWFGITIDVHDRKMAQQALSESENRFRTMAQHSPMWIWMTDKKVNVSYANKVMLSYLGLSHYNEFSGHIWEALTHPDDIELVYTVFREASQKQQPFSFESRVKNSATNLFEWCLFEGVPHFENGEFIGFIGTGLHIHNQKMLQETLEGLVVERTQELEHANKELQRSNEDLLQFAHVASHDLKEPVRKVMTFANRLKDELGAATSETANMYVSKIEKSAIRMYSIIDGVLLYSSLNAVEQTKEEIDLDELIESIAGDLEVPISEKGAEIRYRNLPTVQGSPILLYQLFYNLINNSLKFAKVGVPPVIQLTASQDDSPDMREAKPAEKNYWKIIVEDNGIGFNTLDAEKIFATFTRLHTKDKYEGTGLGLTLCRKIAERHGGTIKAEGRANEGARFTILLPGD